MRGERSYSGEQFITDIESEWGGKLYIGVNPVYAQQLSDVMPRISLGSNALKDFLGKQGV